MLVYTFVYGEATRTVWVKSWSKFQLKTYSHSGYWLGNVN